MKTLQVGTAKSGNSWVYRIIEELYREAGWERGSFIESDPVHGIAREWELSFEGQADIDVIDVEDEALFYRIGSIYRRKIQDEDAYFARASHVWTHSPWRDRTAQVLDRFDACVYIVRDPRDRLLSYADFLFTDYMRARDPHSYEDPVEVVKDQLEPLTERWVEHVHGYLTSPASTEIFFLAYEDLSENPLEKIEQLAEHLGIDPATVDLEAVVDRTTLRSMGESGSGHFRKGRVGSWKEDLTHEQQRRVVRIAGPLLEALGYPRSVDEAPAPGLDVPGRPDAEELARTRKRLRRHRLLRWMKKGLRMGARQLREAI